MATKETLFKSQINVAFSRSFIVGSYLQAKRKQLDSQLEFASSDYQNLLHYIYICSNCCPPRTQQLFQSLKSVHYFFSCLSTLPSLSMYRHYTMVWIAGVQVTWKRNLKLELACLKEFYIGHCHTTGMSLYSPFPRM